MVKLINWRYSNVWVCVGGQMVRMVNYSWLGDEMFASGHVGLVITVILDTTHIKKTHTCFHLAMTLQSLSVLKGTVNKLVAKKSKPLFPEGPFMVKLILLYRFLFSCIGDQNLDLTWLNKTLNSYLNKRTRTLLFERDRGTYDRAPFLRIEKWQGCSKEGKMMGRYNQDTI